MAMVRKHKRRVHGRTSVVKSHHRTAPSNARSPFSQTGGSNVKFDKRRTAKKPGWRKAKSGDWYFENRKNRSDRSGTRV